MDGTRLSLIASAFPLEPARKASNICSVTYVRKSSTRIFYQRKLPQNLRYPRRVKLPPDPGIDRFSNNGCTGEDTLQSDIVDSDMIEEEEEKPEDGIVWKSEEIEAISSLFQGRIPQKPGKLNRERPLPLPLPYKLRPLGLPRPKRNARLASPASATLSKKVYKNPEFLVGLAREIRSLPSEVTVSQLLNKNALFLRKGSLSLTIRELGHMGLPERALQTFSWAKEQPQLYPDDRILASTVEVLARNHELKVPINLKKFISLASRSVVEALVKGFIRGGSLNLAWKLMSVAKNGNRMLSPSIYAKLILELAKNPEKSGLILSVLDDLGEREDMNLSQMDCTAIMKVCIRLRKFDLVESLFNWYRHSGHDPSVVMYTTVIHSRYCEKRCREALALVWEMEASNCLFDLPAYRVVIKLFVVLNDLPRAVRYFSRLKEAGFSPTYDIYRELISVYLASGRLAKCKEINKELQIAGFKLDRPMASQITQLERQMVIRP